MGWGRGSGRGRGGLGMIGGCCGNRVGWRKSIKRKVKELMMVLDDIRLYLSDNG